MHIVALKKSTFRALPIKYNQRGSALIHEHFPPHLTDLTLGANLLRDILINPLPLAPLVNTSLNTLERLKRQLLTFSLYKGKAYRSTYINPNLKSPIIQKAYGYDVNALYPAMACTGNFPGEFINAQVVPNSSTSVKDLLKYPRQTFFFVDVTVLDPLITFNLPLFTQGSIVLPDIDSNFKQLAFK